MQPSLRATAQEDNAFSESKPPPPLIGSSEVPNTRSPEFHCSVRENSTESVYPLIQDGSSSTSYFPITSQSVGPVNGAASLVPAFTKSSTQQRLATFPDGVTVMECPKPAFTTSAFHVVSSVQNVLPTTTAAAIFSPTTHTRMTPSPGGDCFFRYPTPSDHHDRSFLTSTPILRGDGGPVGDSCSSSTKSTSLTTLSPFSTLHTGSYPLPISFVTPAGGPSPAFSGALGTEVHPPKPPPLLLVSHGNPPSAETLLLTEQKQPLSTSSTIERPRSGGAIDGGEESAKALSSAAEFRPTSSFVEGPSSPTMQSNTNLFVRHIPPWMDDVTLESLFARFGEVISASVMRDIHTAQSLGRGFVRFRTHESARQAKEGMNNIIITEPAKREDSNGTKLGQRMEVEGGGVNPSQPSSKLPLSVQWANAKHDKSVSGIEKSRIHKLFVRNIPISVTKDMLRGVFAPFGKITEISLHDDTAAAETTLHSVPHSTPQQTSFPPSARQEARRIAFVTFAGDGEAASAARAVHNTRPFDSCGSIALMVKLAEDAPTHPSKRVPPSHHAATAIATTAAAGLPLTFDPSTRSHTSPHVFTSTTNTIPSSPIMSPHYVSTCVAHVGATCAPCNNNNNNNNNNSNNKKNNNLPISKSSSHHHLHSSFLTPPNAPPPCPFDPITPHATRDLSAEGDGSQYLQNTQATVRNHLVAALPRISPIPWQTNESGVKGLSAELTSNSSNAMRYLTRNNQNFSNNTSSVDLAGGSGGAQLHSMSSMASASASTPHGLQTNNTLNFSSSYTSPTAPAAGQSTAAVSGSHVFLSTNPPCDAVPPSSQPSTLYPAYPAGGPGTWEMHCQAMSNSPLQRERANEAGTFYLRSPPSTFDGCSCAATQIVGSGVDSADPCSPVRPLSETEGARISRGGAGFSFHHASQQQPVSTMPKLIPPPPTTSISGAAPLSINTGVVSAGAYPSVTSGPVSSGGVSPCYAQHSTFMRPQSQYMSKSMVSMLSNTSRGVTPSSVHQRLACASEPNTPSGAPTTLPGGVSSSSPGYYFSVQMTPLLTSSNASWNFVNNNNNNNNNTNSVCISVGAPPDGEEVPSTPGSVLTAMSASVTAPPTRVSSNGVMYPVMSAFTSLPHFSTLDTPTAHHIDPSINPHHHP